MHFVYMIENSSRNLYVGITENPEKRVMYHNQRRGAQYTKRKHDYEIVFLEQHPDLASARKREIQLKKWRRDKKEMLIGRYQKGLPTEIV